MLAQDVAGEIERAADQHVVGRHRLGGDGLPPGVGHRAGSDRRSSAAACRRRRASGSRPSGSPGTGTKRRLAASGSSGVEEAGRDPWSSACRPRDAAARPSSEGRPGSRPAPRRRPDCGRRRARPWHAGGNRRQRGPATSRCSRRRPARLAQPAGDGRGVQCRLVERQCRHHGEPGIVDLMHAEQRRPRQLEPAGPRSRRRIPAGVGATSQSRPCTSSGAPTSAARASITASASGCCGPTTAGTPGFRIPAFSPRSWPACRRDSSHGPSIPATIRHQARLGHHVGGVEPAAQPGLEQHPVGAALGEGQEGRRGGDLEEGDRRAGIGRLAARRGRRRAGPRRSARRRAGCAR